MQQESIIFRGLICVAITLWATIGSAADADRTIALVLSSDAGADRADQIEAHLQSIGAETLRAEDPNTTEMRSILKRFARETADARSAVVYVDFPIVSFETRLFLLPDDATLDNPTDLFTNAIPIKAFARAAAQAEQGGAVLATTPPTDQSLPKGVDMTLDAPEPVPGSSPVLVVAADNFRDLEATLLRATNTETVELGRLLSDVVALGNASVSMLPERTAYLRQPPDHEQNNTQDNADETAGVGAPTNETETEAELVFLEQSLSRSARRALQRELRSLGHYNGLLDGIFGPQTRAAIVAYQASRAEDETGLLTRRQLLDLGF